MEEVVKEIGVKFESKNVKSMLLCFSSINK